MLSRSHQTGLRDGANAVLNNMFQHAPRCFPRYRSRRLHLISHQRKHIQSTAPESQDLLFADDCAMYDV